MFDEGFVCLEPTWESRFTQDDATFEYLLRFLRKSTRAKRDQHGQRGQDTDRGGNGTMVQRHDVLRNLSGWILFTIDHHRRFANRDLQIKKTDVVFFVA